MAELEPKLRQQLESLKLEIRGLDQNPDPMVVLVHMRDLISEIPNRPNNLLNDFMADMRIMQQRWQKSETEEQKAQIKSEISIAAGRIIAALERFVS